MSLEGWKVSGAPKEITDCGGVKILGGFSKFGKGAVAERTFDKLPKHNTVKV